MLAGVEDPHVELHAEINGEPRALAPGDGPTLTRIRAAVDGELEEGEWLPAYRQGVLATVLQGRGQQRGNNRLLFGRVGDIGYLNLLAMEGFAQGGDERREKAVLDAALDEAIAVFRGARAVIVDVSYNLGGHDGLAQRVAARFADERRLAYTKIAYGARDLEPQPFHVHPSKRARYLGPVYLVTSDITVSAGEVFALLMRALPNVVHVGTRTRGALSDQIEKPLPNGWQLSLSAEIYRDPQGEWYELRGVPPQVARDMFPAGDLIGGHARGVLDLMDEIRRQ